MDLKTAVRNWLIRHLNKVNTLDDFCAFVLSLLTDSFHIEDGTWSWFDDTFNEARLTFVVGGELILTQDDSDSMDPYEIQGGESFRITTYEFNGGEEILRTTLIEQAALVLQEELAKLDSRDRWIDSESFKNLKDSEAIVWNTIVAAQHFPRKMKDAGDRHYTEHEGMHDYLEMVLDRFGEDRSWDHLISHFSRRLGEYSRAIFNKEMVRANRMLEELKMCQEPFGRAMAKK